MKVGVGSGNPVKVRATARALAALDGVVTVDGEVPVGHEPVVEPVPVASGVPEQPRGHAETIAGAETRARNVLAAGDGDRRPERDCGRHAAGDGDRRDPDASPRADRGPYHLAVGIEGGVAPVEGTGALFLVMWAAVTDGETTGRGAGPSMALPSSIADRVRDGAELGPVMDDVLGEDDVARKQGAAGALTGGATDRESALASAVTGALGPFVSDLYER